MSVNSNLSYPGQWRNKRLSSQSVAWPTMFCNSSPSGSWRDSSCLLYFLDMLKAGGTVLLVIVMSGATK